MRIGFVLFSWFPQGGLQQDLVKVVRACQGRADLSIHCLDWEGEKVPGVPTEVFRPRRFTSRFTKVGLREAFADHVLHEVKPAVDLVVGFNRLPGLDYYFAADSCFAWRMRQRPWWQALTPRARQYLRFEQAVFVNQSSTTALLLSPLQREQYMQCYHTPSSRLIDLPPGIDRKHCAGVDAASLREGFRTEFNVGPDHLAVLQIGSSFVTKGLDRSLQALAALPPALKDKTHFFLMGRDKHLASWQRRAAEAGLRGLHFLGSEHSVPRCMQGADVLLHPSLHESAGMVILEAVVAGLPVLTTANCGYAWHVQQAAAGLVCPEPFDQRHLNGLLASMLTADRSEWRQNGIDYGQTHNLYDMPTVAADILLNHRLNRRAG